MRTFTTLCAVLLCVLALSACSTKSLWKLNGALMDIDGKDIRVASVNTFGDDHVYRGNSKEFENGIYVVATKVNASKESLPYTTTLIRNYLRSRGIKIAGRPEECALGIRFEVSDLNIDSLSPIPRSTEDRQSKSLVELADELITYKNSIEQSTKFIESFNSASQYGMPQGHYEGTELKLESISIVDPTYEKLDENSLKYIRDRNIITARTAGKKSDPKTTKSDLLTLMVKIWVDKYFVND